MQKSDLPFGSELSPSIIDLAEALEIAKTHEGEKEALEDAFRGAFFAQNETSERNKRKLAMNLRLGMKHYLIIDENLRLTDFGNHLHSIRDDPDLLYHEFAKHILLHLHGLTLIQCVQDMQFAGEKVTLVTLREALEKRGIHFPRGGKHPSMMRLWLEKAGVFKSGWWVNQTKLEEILGAGAIEIEALAQMSPEQSAFLKAMGNIGDGNSYFSNEIEKLASATYGIKFNEKMLPKTVLYPLRDAGYVTLQRGTKKPGRGAKPFLVTLTSKFREDIIIPIIEQLEEQVHADLRPLLRKPLNQIIKELNHESRHIRGLALEAFAFKIMRIVDLNYVATRLRGSVTGGAEVDLIFDSSRLVFTRWQVQCKNTKSISLDDVAKEVGLTHFLKSNVVVVIGTGGIGPVARQYARKVMQDSNLAVVMIDGKDIEAIVKDPPYIVDVLNREAKHAMRLKELDISKYDRLL